jgi:hypothetical protein
MTAWPLNRIAIDAGGHWRKPPFPGTRIRGSDIGREKVK